MSDVLAHGDRRGVWRLAMVGAVLLASGLPWPVSTPPWLAVRGFFVLGLGLLVTFVSVRDARSAIGAGALWLERAGGAVVVVVGVAMVFVAWLQHVEATTIPLAGNTVRADAASLERGAALWARHCASCHEERPAIDGLTDREIMERLVRGGDEMHGFAYDLDHRARGDVINYVRSLPPGARLLRGAAPDGARDGPNG